jgi:conjugal transfer/entry exclusion protein
MRLQALLVAQSRAEALERAREMEVLAQARAQHAHFFGGARRRIPSAALALRPDQPPAGAPMMPGPPP